MGEHRLPKISHVQIPTDSLELIDCARRNILIFSDAFNAILFLKEPDDDLSDWPIGSIVAVRVTDPRAALDDAIVKEVRKVNGHYEIPIPDTSILLGHYHDMRLRGLEPRVSPTEFLAAVKGLFRTEAGAGWIGIAASTGRPYWVEGATGRFTVSGREAML